MPRYRSYGHSSEDEGEASTSTYGNVSHFAQNDGRDFFRGEEFLSVTNIHSDHRFILLAHHLEWKVFDVLLNRRFVELPTDDAFDMEDRVCTNGEERERESDQKNEARRERKDLLSGFDVRRFFAASPINRTPSGVKATHDGVMRLP